MEILEKGKSDPRKFTERDFETVTEPATCLDCKAPMTTMYMRGFPGFRVLRCNDCIKVWEARQYPKDHENRHVSWKSICPPLYLGTKRELLPVSESLYNQVHQWEWSARGILLGGNTGSGKTRTMLKLMERLHFEGRTVKMFFGQEFAHKCAKVFGAHEGEDWIGILVNADILFLDDLGKTVSTDRVESELYNLCEQRFLRCKPVFATTQFIGSELEGKFTKGADRGTALVRRLREFCECIPFSRQTENPF